MTRRRTSLGLALLLLVLGAAGARAQSVEDTVREIRAGYLDVGRRIEMIHEGGDAAAQAMLVLDEVTINRGNHSWPAVGIYRMTVRYYYDWREAVPYPDRLRKVTVTAEVSARHTYNEFYFDETGALRFFFEQEREVEEPRELRIYYRDGSPVRVHAMGETFEGGEITDQIRRWAAAHREAAEQFREAFRAQQRSLDWE